MYEKNPYLDNIDIDVSGNDTASILNLQNTYSPEAYTVSDPDLNTGIPERLESIDSKLTGIIFLILFAWCARHVANAVRSFTVRRMPDD